MHAILLSWSDCRHSESGDCEIRIGGNWLPAEGRVVDLSDLNINGVLYLPADTPKSIPKPIFLRAEAPKLASDDKQSELLRELRAMRAGVDLLVEALRAWCSSSQRRAP